MDILPRPNGTGGGLEAYCWTQVADFLKALITEPHSNPNSKLLPGLKSLRIDLVNFSHHIPWARARLTALVRLNLGELVDELMVSMFISISRAEASQRTRSQAFLTLNDTPSPHLFHFSRGSLTRLHPDDRHKLRIRRPRLRRLRRKTPLLPPPPRRPPHRRLRRVRLRQRLPQTPKRHGPHPTRHPRRRHEIEAGPAPRRRHAAEIQCRGRDDLEVGVGAL